MPSQPCPKNGLYSFGGSHVLRSRGLSKSRLAFRTGTDVDLKTTNQLLVGVARASKPRDVPPNQRTVTSGDPLSAP